tara:strand:+ start:5548 stop:8100 length:2553 start_codon:yes stop_codon:yes gene_type:complete
VRNTSSNKTYNPFQIEKKWQQTWQLNNLYRTNENSSKEKFYALSMFPYPSGNLHMGHVRNYVITDLIARYQKLKGKNVLHPMGWDAFGLPAENAAIERGIDPNEWTQKNIKHMKSQLEILGLSVDWEKEFATCDKKYYIWTQKLFLDLFKAGLVYQKESEVNWDPIDNTVLANEQVDSDGKSWRSGALVEKKQLMQWYLKITDYAEELINDLKILESWPERVKLMQENWVGKSIGANITFKIKGYKDSVVVFTTRPDTIYGVTYIAISANHKLTELITDIDLKDKLNSLKVDLQKTKYLNKQKNGFFTGLKAINPINDSEIPIWIATYVLDGYGTGSVMGVPAHDQRDFEFANQNKIKIKQVISKNKDGKDENLKRSFEECGFMMNSNKFNGLQNSFVKKEIIKVGTNEGWAEKRVLYRLRDWLISRQRYWGCPIPIIFCAKCGSVPIDEKDLPVELPNNLSFEPNKINSLKDDKKWLNVKCPKCGCKAKRETDTMDTFMCSSWYFLRYPCSNLQDKPFEQEKIDKWLPVDQYVGGVEHAILHLLYARFLTKALRDRNLFSINEPFNNLLTQGMVQAAAYKNPKTGKYISPKVIKNLENPLDPNDNTKLEISYEKMSKSKYNGIDPETVIEKYGADTARMFILFKAPPEKDLEWGDSDVEGQYRFLCRIWKLYKDNQNEELFNKQNYKEQKELDLKRDLNIAIKEIGKDISNNQFNTGISELMKLYNSISQSNKNISESFRKEVLKNFCILLSPFAPHITEEIWQELGYKDSIHNQKWPEIDLKALVQDSYELVIQINGKVRDKVFINSNSSDEEIKEISLKRENIKKWVADKAIKKFIVIKGKIINLVV